MSLFFGEDDLFGKKGSRIIDSSDSSFTVNGSGKTLQIRPKADKYRIENGNGGCVKKTTHGHQWVFNERRGNPCTPRQPPVHFVPKRVTILSYSVQRNKSTL
jgi:hypothetical protein